jgi:metallophosphoesterase (TIGR00282 family)
MSNVVRPLNIKSNLPQAKIGNGSIVFKFQNKTLRITNLLGNTVVCHDIQDNPFPILASLLKNDKSDIHIVDLHTETTSEKNAFLLTFAGKVSAILGTHTHVQTADEKIYKNTAYITDVGMTGANLGVIGAKPETILDMFMGKSDRFKLEPATGPYQFNAVVVCFDHKTNKPTKIERINIVK